MIFCSVGYWVEGRYYAPYKTGEAMNYYLGLDNGGSVSKAALYDVTGAELCVSSVKTSMIVIPKGIWMNCGKRIAV